MVTVYDVATTAGVSIATVSRALNDRGRISAATRAHVLEVAGQLGYQPNDLARGLVGMSTKTIALLLPDIANPYFPELVKGVQTVADEYGHLLLLCHDADDEKKALADIATLRRKQVDGIMLPSGTLSGSRLAAAVEGLPLVLLDRTVRGVSAAHISVDNRAGARNAVRHLLDLGHQRIAHVSGPAGIISARQRKAGWADALREAGHEPTLVETGNFLEDGGYAAARTLLAGNTDFTAVFAANDLTAIGVLAAFADAGLRVPRDVSVVGFDGLQLTSYLTPKLTTVAQPIGDIGRAAATLLLQQISGELTGTPRSVILPTHLLVRDSSGPPPRRPVTSGKKAFR
ncbi:LacI family DNA-binding transcriptional regulator [Fodinicola acaciae]|uniref:LacI family DNA-binding transcriptional regulator n=1 Tax=Fodinicola acaciae TaxID=2681555 RepID=UPI0013D39E96|nr:LacI family DNA-binding transcriptional regulator [Fodinicola acaciae]